MNVYHLHMYNGNIQQNPLCVESILCHYGISDFFHRDAISLLLRARHLRASSIRRCSPTFCAYLAPFLAKSVDLCNDPGIEHTPCRNESMFCEIVLSVSSRVSLLILCTNAESGAYARDCSRCSRRRRYIFASTTHDRVNPEFIGSRNCVPLAFTAESPLAQASSPQGSSSNECCLCIIMDQMILCSSLFPHPLLVYIEYVQIIGSISKYQYCCTAILFCAPDFWSVYV